MNLEVGLMQKAPTPADKQIGLFHGCTQTTWRAQAGRERPELATRGGVAPLGVGGIERQHREPRLLVPALDLLQDSRQDGLVACVFLPVVAADEVSHNSPSVFEGASASQGALLPEDVAARPRRGGP
jgi:hypothetical protein